MQIEARSRRSALTKGRSALRGQQRKRYPFAGHTAKARSEFPNKKKMGKEWGEGQEEKGNVMKSFSGTKR